MTPYPPFETERLLIRPTSLEDAAFYFELMNSPKWIRYIGQRNVNSEEDAVEYIKNRMFPQLETLGHTNNTIIRKSDNVKLGNCGLYHREGKEGLEIGFAFLPQYEKQGYAFEATSKLKEIGLNVYGAKAITAVTTVDNYSSHKLLKKLGLTLVGPTTLPNDDADLVLFKL